MAGLYIAHLQGWTGPGSPLTLSRFCLVCNFKKELPGIITHAVNSRSFLVFSWLVGEADSRCSVLNPAFLNEFLSEPIEARLLLKEVIRLDE